MKQTLTFSITWYNFFCISLHFPYCTWSTSYISIHCNCVSIHFLLWPSNTTTRSISKLRACQCILVWFGQIIINTYPSTKHGVVSSISLPQQSSRIVTRLLCLCFPKKLIQKISHNSTINCMFTITVTIELYVHFLCVHVYFLFA